MHLRTKSLEVLITAYEYLILPLKKDLIHIMKDLRFSAVVLSLLHSGDVKTNESSSRASSPVIQFFLLGSNNAHISPVLPRLLPNSHKGSKSAGRDTKKGRSILSTFR